MIGSLPIAIYDLSIKPIPYRGRNSGMKSENKFSIFVDVFDCLTSQKRLGDGLQSRSMSGDHSSLQSLGDLFEDDMNILSTLMI